jgi:gluconate 5-dehydrogenase
MTSARTDVHGNTTRVKCHERATGLFELHKNYQQDHMDTDPRTKLFDLSGKTALITGSARGIGYAIAEALLQAGARVILNSRSPEALAAAAAQLRGKGGAVETCAFDVCDPEAVEAAVGHIERTIAPIDILVNNAGMQRRAPLEQFKNEDWRELMATNLDSVFYVSKAVAPHMISRGRGKIINIGSVQCELARPGIAPYTASKGAIRNLTRGMCADWARHGLQINAIGPGYFATPLNKALVEDPEFDEWLRKRTPAGRWGRLEDLHGAAVFLASGAADFINGQTLYVDGGILAVI